MRILTAGQKYAIGAPRVRMAFLVEILLPDLEPLYLTTSAHTMFVAGKEWLGAGRMLNITLPQEDASMEAHSCEVSLDGLDPATISLALREPLEGAPVTIYGMNYDPDTNLPIDSPWVYHVGTVSAVKILPPSTGNQ